MKFCYIDETGTDGRAPVVVFTGIVADSTRVHRTRREFNDLFTDLAALPERPIQELKGSNMYFGKGRWDSVDGATRHEAMERLFDWIADRQHRLALAALPVAEFESSDLKQLTGLDIWMAGALHVVLQAQKCHQTLRSNKGATVLVFDEQKVKADRFGDLLNDPPAWSDSYYNRDPRRDSLDQIVDTAFFARSDHTGLVQAADVISFVFRRYSELHDFDHDEEYSGETGKIDHWIDGLSARLLDRSHRWAQRTSSDLAKAYTALGPESLMALGG